MGTRKKKARAARRKKPRRPAPPVTDPVYGIRCRVVELHYLEDTLELMADTNGRRFTVPIDALVGKDALNVLQKGALTWLTVRLEKPS